jgi:hypothetical protein
MSDSKINVILKIKPLIPLDQIADLTFEGNEVHYKGREYNFSRIFLSNITQEDFFYATIEPRLLKLLDGDDFLIFSYGITNSGKTHTMIGTNEDPGIIHRTIDAIFIELKDKLMCSSNAYKHKPCKFHEIGTLDENDQKELYQFKKKIISSSEPQHNKIPKFSTHYSIWISYYELYNEEFNDLLAQPRSQANRNESQVKLRDEGKLPYVEGLVQIPLFNTQEAMKVLEYGQKNLKRWSNNINTNSSRSHSVLSLKIIRREANEKISLSQMSLCDLAGEENFSKTKGSKDSTYINKSLTCLRNCMRALIQNQTK